MTTYFHTTDAAYVILRDGFRDGTGNYMLVGFTLTGVSLADRPVDSNEGAQGGEVLMVELGDEVNIAEFELVEDGAPYREWWVPAEILNRHATVRLLVDDEQVRALLQLRPSHIQQRERA